MNAVLSPKQAQDVLARVQHAPDLMEIIERAAPGKDGLALLYTVAGGLDMRVASLAGTVTNAMAGLIRAGEPDGYGVMPPTVDSYNDAMAALDEAQSRNWALDMIGIKQTDMVDDLKGLFAFRNLVVERIERLSGREFPDRWEETIAMAASPRAVEEWKLDLSWSEYVEECDGEVEITEAEFRALKAKELQGKPRRWKDFAQQVMDTIIEFDGQVDENFSFSDLKPEVQLRLLESLSTEQRERTLRTSALKRARDVHELDVSRRIIKGFMAEVRAACDHPRFDAVKARRAGDGL